MLRGKRCGIRLNEKVSDRAKTIFVFLEKPNPTSLIQPRECRKDPYLVQYCLVYKRFHNSQREV